MARFETMVPTSKAGVFNTLLWEFVERMLGNSVQVYAVRRYPDAAGDRWIVEMDDADRLEELKLQAREKAGCGPRNGLGSKSLS